MLGVEPGAGCVGASPSPRWRASVIETFRKTFHLVGRDKPGRWVALIVGAVVVSVLEMLGAVLIYLLLAILADPGGSLDIPLVGDLRNVIGDVDDTRFLLGAAVVLGVFFLIRAAVQVAYTYIKHRLAHNAGSRLSTKLTRGYLRLPYSFHLRRSSSELIRNAHQNVEELALHCFLSVIQVIAELLLIVGLVTVMLIVAPAATGLAVVIVGSASLLLLKLVQPRLRRLGARAQDMRKRTLSSLQQSLQGIRDIKVLGTESYFAGDYQQSRDDLARSLYLRGTVIEMPRLVIETSLIGFILILFAVSVAVGTATGELLSTLGLFAYAGLRMQPSLQKLVSGLNSVRYSGAAVADVYDDLLLVEQLDTHEPAGSELSFEQELRLDAVTFTYEGMDRPAVLDADLTIRPGEVIGVCGPRVAARRRSPT
jgi:ATP-binding cassette, subfamily B, bacterial PglK